MAEAGERRKKAVGPKAMFTGIVEEVGEVSEMFMDIKVPGVTLTLRGDTVLEGCYEGCSISVNGVCLTVTKFTDKEFTVGVAPETLRVTNREIPLPPPLPLPSSPSMHPSVSLSSNLFLFSSHLLPLHLQPTSYQPSPPETLSRPSPPRPSNSPPPACPAVGDLIPGSKVNLERAAAMDGRNSGHMVQGHVDDTGDV